MSTYSAALSLTLAIEVPLYIVLLGAGAAVPWCRALAVAVLVNLISHPLFNAVIVPAADRVLPDAAAIASGELVVCILEATLVWWWLHVPRALAVAASLVANGASFGVGLIVLDGVRLW